MAAALEALTGPLDGLYWEPSRPVGEYPITDADHEWASRWGWHSITKDSPHYVALRCRQLALWFQALLFTLRHRHSSCTWAVVSGFYGSLWKQGHSPQSRTGIHWPLLAAPQPLRQYRLCPATHMVCRTDDVALPPAARLSPLNIPVLHALTSRSTWGLQTAQLDDRLQQLRHHEGLAIWTPQGPNVDIERFLGHLRDRVTVLRRYCPS